MAKPPAVHLKCPYTLLPLAELEAAATGPRPAISTEHIFPDSIGGVKDYAIRVSSKANSELGARIDAPLAASFLVSGLRMMHGIRSRSGDPELTLRGRIEGTNKEVELTFSGHRRPFSLGWNRSTPVAPGVPAGWP